MPSFLPLLFAVRAVQTPSGVDQAALDHLIARCKESQSWGLVVMKDGKVVCDQDFGKPKYNNMMSATKAVTSMAVGALLTDRTLPDVDITVKNIYPAFHGGKRDYVTTRHLLEHSSGLALYSESEFPENRVAAALTVPIRSIPGAYFEYNNRAVDLLSGVIRQLAGKPLDLYAFSRIFQPLGILPGDFIWGSDPDGNPHGCAELAMRPRCMALLGQLMLQKGMWEGKRILSEDYVERATHESKVSSDHFGLYNNNSGWLWWICQPHVTFEPADYDRMVKALKLDQTQKERLHQLVGSRFLSMENCEMNCLEAVGGLPKALAAGFKRIDSEKFPCTDQPVKDSDWEGFYANGWGGQYIMVLPSRGLVVVRTGGEGFQSADDPYKYEMPDMYNLASALVPQATH